MKSKIQFSVFSVCACLIAFSCSNRSVKDNQSYLVRIADVVIESKRTLGRLPGSIDEALENSKRKLPHRGDINGRMVHYLNLGNRAFIIRSVGLNRKDEGGAGDDVQLNFADEMQVSLEELSRFLKANDPGIWEIFPEIFNPRH